MQKTRSTHCSRKPGTISLGMRVSLRVSYICCFEEHKMLSWDIPLTLHYCLNLLDHESTFIKPKGPQAQIKAQESQSPRKTQAQDSETSSRIREERIRGQGLDSTPPRPSSPRPLRPTCPRPSRPLSQRPQYPRFWNLGIEDSNLFACYTMWSYPSNSNIRYLETRNQVHYLQEFGIQIPQQPNLISIS